jgi:hypothetical protein
MVAGGGDRGGVAGIALEIIVQVGWFIEVSLLGMQEYIRIGEITIETMCGVDIDGIIARYLIMSSIVIGKVGTTGGIGETTVTGVLKADTIMADKIYEKTEWNVVTRDKTPGKIAGKTEWNAVTRDKIPGKIADKIEWNAVTRDKIPGKIADKIEWNAVTRGKIPGKIADKIEWNAVTRDKIPGKTEGRTERNAVTRGKTRDKINKVRELSNIKVVLDSNLLLVVTDIKVIRSI